MNPGAFYFFAILFFPGASRHAALPDSSVRSLINQQRVRDGLAIPSHPPLPISLSLCLPPLPLSPPCAPGVAASPLPPGQLKDRAHPPGPFLGDRGLKEPRRGPSSPEPCAGGPPCVKPRRHSDTDKPKGKRPCKTKHTSQREREKRKEAPPGSPGQRCAADLGAAEDDKVSARGGRGGRGGGGAAGLRYIWPFAAAKSVSVCLSAPLIMQLGEGGRKEVCLQCLEGCWSFDLLVPLSAPCGAPAGTCVLSLARNCRNVCH